MSQHASLTNHLVFVECVIVSVTFMLNYEV